MKKVWQILLMVLLVQGVASAQFGPNKKVLKSRIDTLAQSIDAIHSELGLLRFSDSLTISDLKRFESEQNDLRVMVLELNRELLKSRDEISKLNRQQEELRQAISRLRDTLVNHHQLLGELLNTDSDSSSTVDPEPVSEPVRESRVVSGVNFLNFASEFIESVRKQGEAGLKPYLNDSGSFYFLSVPGFITSVTEINDPSELSEEIPWRMAMDALKKSRFTFQEGEKPLVDCERAELYNKQGIYGGLEEGFRKVSASLDALREFSTEDEKKLGKAISDIRTEEQSVVAYIYSTDGHLGFYFVKSAGTWKLFCLDVNDPCSA